VAELRDLCEYFTARRHRRIEPGSASAGLICRRWNPEQSDLTELHEAIMASWVNNYGFAPIDLAEFTQTFASFARLFEPSWCFWFRDDRAARAFGFGHLDPPVATMGTEASARGPSRAIMKAYGIAPAYRGTHLVYEILRQLTWQAHAIERLPAILSLATERSDLWSRFKSPARTHAILFKCLSG
jgi:RimJ/RimL family protein N-acetyltransferase